MKTLLTPLLFLAAATTTARGERPKKQALDVTSSAFTASSPIPTEYTCDGAGTSPPLEWSKVPAETKSIALLVVDPDAPRGTFTHWLVTGISPQTTSLAKGQAVPQGAMLSKNDAGKPGWMGPCPPSGTHHYVFRVYALDIPLAKRLSRVDFESQIRGHVVAEGELVGTYERHRG